MKVLLLTIFYFSFPFRNLPKERKLLNLSWATFNDHVRFGTLWFGRISVHYPVLFYEDNFEVSCVPHNKESIGGIYMNSLALHLYTNYLPSLINFISLTIYGHKCLIIFHCMIPDILQATLQGIPSTDTYGRQIVIFMNVLGFTADYFASSPMNCVRSHASICHCKCCTFERRQNNEGTAFAYSTIFKIRRPAYIFISLRTLSLRCMGLSEK